MKKIYIVFLTVLLMSSSLVGVKAKNRRYSEMTFLSGNQPDLKMFINANSLNLDLAKTNNIRLSFQVNDLIAIVPNQGAVRVDLYEVTGGNRTFVARHSLNLNAGARKNRVLSIDAGFFASPTKEIEVDLRDAANNIINTYTTTLSANNLVAQAEANNNINLDAQIVTANCDNDTFGECQIDAFFKNVDFIPYRSRQPASEVFKTEAGRYQVRIPYPRKFVRFFRGKRTKVKIGSFTDTGTTNGATTAGFGETLDISRIRLGPNLTDYENFSYDTVNGNFVLGSGTGPTTFTDNFYFNDAGRLGIGVNTPLAKLHLMGGTTSTPSMIIENGTLTTSPIDGALEFDGNNLYLTKNGIRGVLGAQGPTGPIGPVGPAGATGPAGPAGNVVNGGTINGATTINGNLIVDDEVHARLFNGDVFNGGIFNGTFIGDGSGLTGITAVANFNNGTTTNGTLQDATLNGTTTINGPVVLTANGSIPFATASTTAESLDDGDQTLALGGTNGSIQLNVPSGGSSNVNLPASGTLATINGITPVGVSAPIDIDGLTSIDVTGLNFIPVQDSGAGTIENLTTFTGGTTGQRITIQLLANVQFMINNVGAFNTIQWGRGTSAGPRLQVSREMFTFIYDGNSWHLLDRFTL